MVSEKHQPHQSFMHLRLFLSRKAQRCPTRFCSWLQLVGKLIKEMNNRQLSVHFIPILVIGSD